MTQKKAKDHEQLNRTQCFPLKHKGLSLGMCMTFKMGRLMPCCTDVGLLYAFRAHTSDLAQGALYLPPKGLQMHSSSYCTCTVFPRYALPLLFARKALLRMPYSLSSGYSVLDTTVKTKDHQILGPNVRTKTRPTNERVTCLKRRRHAWLKRRLPLGRD